MFVKLHHSSFIATAVAVIRSTEDRYNVLVMGPVVAISDKLMSSRNKIKSVLLIVLLRNVLTEGISSTSWRHAPTTSVVRIRPQEVTHGSFMRNLLHSVQFLYLVEGVEMRRQATMQTEDLVLHNCCDWEVIKEVSKVTPDVSTSILSVALIIEAIDLCDLSTFVIASKNSNPVGEPNFEQNQDHH